MKNLFLVLAFLIGCSEPKPDQSTICAKSVYSPKLRSLCEADKWSKEAADCFEASLVLKDAPKWCADNRLTPKQRESYQAFFDHILKGVVKERQRN